LSTATTATCSSRSPYQVASAALGLADIAQPIRTVLSGQENAFVMMGEVIGIDLAQGSANVGESRLSCDSLILAPGATDNCFGHPEWQRCGVPR
jgi:NADH dehydrogenase